MATPKKKIKFLVDVEVLAQGKVEFAAKAGEVKELSASSANRWIRRGSATIDIKGTAKEEAAGEVVEAKQDAPITSNEEAVNEKEPEKPAAVKKTAPRKKAVEK